MKVAWIISAMLILTACADDIKTTQGVSASAKDDVVKPAYDDSWYLSPGWPGEYPNGFTILTEGVVLGGRDEMNKASPKSVPCPVPHMANYNPWNNKRLESDKLDFVAAAKTFDLKVSEGGTVPAFIDEDDLILTLEAGETFTYLTYIAEGLALVQYKGVEYQVNESDLENTVDFGEQREVAYDLWVNIPCADKKRGWVLYAEVQGVDGIGETEHTAYGVSLDLTQ